MKHIWIENYTLANVATFYRCLRCKHFSFAFTTHHVKRTLSNFSYLGGKGINIKQLKIYNDMSFEDKLKTSNILLTKTYNGINIHDQIKPHVQHNKDVLKYDCEELMVRDILV